MTTVRYRAVSESTDLEDDEAKYCRDDSDTTGVQASSSYESFGTCDLLLDTDTETSSSRSHPRTGTYRQVCTGRYAQVGR